ncbi:MAG: ribonuclease III [Pseudomonadota bacterium]|nr:ribonuclease III [Pseudomonadota bacterium]
MTGFAKLHAFRNPALLAQALTHSSNTSERPHEPDNQRFEFLGDAVLQLLVSELLTERYPTWDEGALSKARSRVVDTDNLTALSTALGLPAAIRGDKGLANEIARGSKVVADVFEAFVAAVYLDAGLARTREVFTPLLGPTIERLSDAPLLDPKSALQQHLEMRGRALPRYVLASHSGPDHDRTFTVEVYAEERLLGVGTARRKQRAEAEAAQMALAALAAEAVEAAAPARVGPTTSQKE